MPPDCPAPWRAHNLIADIGQVERRPKYSPVAVTTGVETKGYAAKPGMRLNAVELERLCENSEMTPSTEKFVEVAYPPPEAITGANTW